MLMRSARGLPSSTSTSRVTAFALAAPAGLLRFALPDDGCQPSSSIASLKLRNGTARIPFASCHS
jgi:hypothetical protein